MAQIDGDKLTLFKDDFLSVFDQLVKIGDELDCGSAARGMKGIIDRSPGFVNKLEDKPINIDMGSNYRGISKEKITENKIILLDHIDIIHILWNLNENNVGHDLLEIWYYHRGAYENPCEMERRNLPYEVRKSLPELNTFKEVMKGKPIIIPITEAKDD